MINILNFDPESAKDFVLYNSKDVQDKITKYQQIISKSGLDISLYDTIDISEEAINDLTEKYARYIEHEPITYNILSHRAIESFVINLEDMLVVYKPSVFSETVSDGAKHTPLVDAIVQYKENDDYNTLINVIGIASSDDTKCGTWQPITIAHSKNQNVKSKYARWCSIMHTVSTLYVAIQDQIQNKPTIITEAKTSTVTKPGKKHKKQRKPVKNKVVLVKHIVIHKEDIVRPHIQKNFTCPSWGVAGHYRHYKSGKVVWIAPYKKGKERDKTYTPKEYIIPKEQEP